MEWHPLLSYFPTRSAWNDPFHFQCKDKPSAASIPMCSSGLGIWAAANHAPASSTSNLTVPTRGRAWSSGQHTLHPISRPHSPLPSQPDWPAGHRLIYTASAAIPISDVTRSIVHARSRSGPCLYCIDAHAFPPAINVRRVRSEGSMPCHAPWRGSAARALWPTVGWRGGAEPS